MKKVNLRKVELKDETAYKCYIQSWGNEPMIPTSSRFRQSTFEKYLKELKSNEQGREEWVPAETYFLFLENGEIAGAVNCRYALNDFLKKIGGHIGYGISPEYRRLGLAKRMLEETLKLYKQKQFDRVLLTADDQNIGSVKTILACGGVKTEFGLKEDGTPYGKYWIEL